ncbi:MAG TPA: ABC transporter permease [Pyrinomonadaceae bacterium]|jgi:lipopolysaccharide transport system permease protein|nr:ABC transporter permease [Pyrinomonadaceae bacterium]
MDFLTSKSADVSEITNTALDSHPDARSPDKPIIIEPSQAWAAFDLRSLWTYRELVYFLMWRDLKVRYKQTFLGMAWAIMQPLLTTLIFTIFLGKLARVPSDDIPYPIFVYAGLLPWTFFANAFISSGNSVVGNAHLVSKVYFPRIIIPISAVGGRLVDFAISFSIFIGLMAYYGVAVTWNILMLPALVALVALFALAVGMWTSALNVKYRDVGVALPVLIQFWMFASPVVYPSSLVPPRWRWAYAINPLTGVIDGFRSALFGREFNWVALAVSTGITLILLAYAFYAFRRMEKDFADLI